MDPHLIQGFDATGAIAGGIAGGTAAAIVVSSWDVEAVETPESLGGCVSADRVGTLGTSGSVDSGTAGGSSETSIGGGVGSGPVGGVPSCVCADSKGVALSDARRTICKYFCTGTGYLLGDGWSTPCRAVVASAVRVVKPRGNARKLRRMIGETVGLNRRDDGNGSGRG